MRAGRKWILLLLLAGAMFLLLLGRREFASSHEARVGQVARQMAASGWPWNARKVRIEPVHLARRSGDLRLAPDPDAPPVYVNPWIVPILSGQVRLQKPPLPYWCAAITYRFFGVDEGTSRLVPALLGVLATFLLYDLVFLLYGRRVALAAVLIWLTTFLVPEEYRLAMADPYLAFFTLAALWAWIRAAYTSNRSFRGKAWQVASDSEDGKTAHVPVYSRRVPAGGFILLFYVALALGALAKGPVVLVQVVVPLVLFHVCFRVRAPRGWLGHLIGVAIFLGIALPWPAAVMRRVPHAMDIWKYESVGEVSGANRENLRAWWYYLVNLPLMAMPWVPLWLFSIAFPFIKNRSRLFFPVLWYGAIVLFFSLVGQKKLPYLLPMMPAQAMMIALAAVPLLRVARRRFMRGLPGAIIAAQAIIGIGWAAALPVLVWQYPQVRAIGLIVSVLAILVAVFPIRQMLAGRAMHWMTAQAAAYAAILLVFCNLYLTPLNNVRSPVRLCRELNRMADGTHRALLEARLPEEVAFYLPLHPPHGPAPSRYLVVVDDHLAVAHRAPSNRPAPASHFQDFEGWVPDARLVGVRRLQIPGAAGNSRWRVYELTVRRNGFALR